MGKDDLGPGFTIIAGMVILLSFLTRAIQYRNPLELITQTPLWAFLVLLAAVIYSLTKKPRK